GRSRRDHPDTDGRRPGGAEAVAYLVVEGVGTGVGGVGEIGQGGGVLAHDASQRGGRVESDEGDRVAVAVDAAGRNVDRDRLAGHDARLQGHGRGRAVGLLLAGRGIDGDAKLPYRGVPGRVAHDVLDHHRYDF